MDVVNKKHFSSFSTTKSNKKNKRETKMPEKSLHHAKFKPIAARIDCWEFKQREKRLES